QAGLGIFAEGQRSLPHPQFSKKMRLNAPSPNMTIRIAVRGSTEFKSPAALHARYPKSVLHKCHDFQHRGKEALTSGNGNGRIDKPDGPQSPCLGPNPSESPRIACFRHPADANAECFFAGAESLIDCRAGFLYPAVNGEVAEWSKALPC